MASILMIEDNMQHARLTSKILSREGHVIFHAENAMEGLRLVPVAKPEIVLLDIDLPDLDGKTLANRLSRLPELRHVPIVAVSADHSLVTKRLALAYGCDGFVTKPLDLHQFPREVEKYLAASAELRKKAPAATH